MTEQQFDVFLAHSSKDKPLIRQIYQKLTAQGIRPWLDEEGIAPGTKFQDEIQQAIGRIKTTAIFLGESGLGPWQALELKSFISQCVRRGIPVIPVLLPGVEEIPEDLIFLQEFHAVLFRDSMDDENALFSLQWGITGQKPTTPPPRPQPHPPAQPANPTFEFETITITIEKTGFFGQGAPNVITRAQKGQAEYHREDLGNGITLDLVKIPGGRFQMGALAGKEGRSGAEGPQHSVTVPEFWLGKYAVTQAQYQAVMGANLSRFTENGANRPVEKVSWQEAVAFCEKLSQQTGRTYRLPSEAEWEYACRAGTTTPFHFGATMTTDLANYNGNYTYGDGPKGMYLERTTEVGSFPPNAFGLYDMHGNVWEWCADHWHGNYDGAPIDGTAWLSSDESAMRLLRGGSWGSDPRFCRSANRSWLACVSQFGSFGFRLVCASSWVV